MNNPETSLRKSENGSTAKAVILCVCDDHSLLVTRCAVLQKDGYLAHAATVRDVTQPPLEIPYDLAILCSTLTAEEKQRVKACIAKETLVLDLQGFVHPLDLLQRVAKCCRERQSATP